MTYTKVIAEIKAKGVLCKTDMGLYEPSYNNYLRLLSIYGSPQQVKAIFGVLASGYDCRVTIDSKEITLERRYSSLRFRSTSLGYGKRHGLIWSEGIGKNTIVWLSPEEKLKALRSAISRRRVPFDKSWINSIEEILLAEGYITELHGWGGIGGYKCDWDDDAICHLIAEKIIKPLAQDKTTEPFALFQGLPIIRRKNHGHQDNL